MSYLRRLQDWALRNEERLGGYAIGAAAVAAFVVAAWLLSTGQ